MGPLASVTALAGLVFRVAGGAGVLGCVEWSATERTSFFDEYEPSSPTPYCRRSGCEGSETCDEVCLVALEGCDVWWRRVTEDVIPPIPELAVRLPGDGGLARDPPLDVNSGGSSHWAV